jgi:Uma2 family endonuclease
VVNARHLRASRRQRVVLRVASALESHLSRYPAAGVAFTSPADISWGPDVLVQPDVFVASLEEARALTWSSMQTLLLVVEVLSPSTARADRFLKRLRYGAASIPLYWVIDADDGAAEIWTPSDDFPTMERERLVWRPPLASEPFTMTIEELLRPI